jgi:hypothetical protein
MHYLSLELWATKQDGNRTNLVHIPQNKRLKTQLPAVLHTSFFTHGNYCSMSEYKLAVGAIAFSIS